MTEGDPDYTIWQSRDWGKWGPPDSDSTHYSHWHELPGFPTQAEFDRMPREQMDRLMADLERSIAEPGYRPEPWWREQ